MSVRSAELGISATDIEVPIVIQTSGEKFPKAAEVVGENVLNVSEAILDRIDEIPDSVRVTSLKPRRHRWSRTRGTILPKPDERKHYRVEDALRQLTEGERGFQITGRDETGRRIEPITVLVFPETDVRPHKVVYSTIADTEARQHRRPRKHGRHPKK